MKSERRHHLQQNELAGHLGTARHWIEPYTVPLLAGIVVVILGIILIGFFRSRAANQRSDATLGLLLSTAQEDAEAYNLVSTDFAGTTPAMIATLAKADAFLREGIEAMYSDRDLSHSRLEDAREAYREVADSELTPLLESRAYYGLAQTLETQGDLEAAIDAYRQVIELNESDAMVSVAEDRIAALERPGTQEFVTWFAEQKPTAFDPGTPPGMPDAGSLPEMPDFTLPGLNSSDPSANAPGASDAVGEPAPQSAGDEGVEDASPENVEIAIPDQDAEPEVDAAEEAASDEGEAVEPAEAEDTASVEDADVEEADVEEADVEEGEAATGSPDADDRRAGDNAAEAAESVQP